MIKANFKSTQLLPAERNIAQYPVPVQNTKIKHCIGCWMYILLIYLTKNYIRKTR